MPAKSSMHSLPSVWQPDLYNLRKIWYPARFQGHLRKHNYFEGWYFKVISADKRHVYAIIPGVSVRKRNEDAYAFIQVIDGRSGETHFVRYALQEFSYARQAFRVRIGENDFSTRAVQLNIDKNGLQLDGSLQFSNLRPYPVRMFSPGVMGWYRFVPRMQCYHGILSMQHDIKGHLTLAGRSMNFNEGKGYMEKDWGSSMPIAWIWIQSNHFTEVERSLSISIAHIPWLNGAFTGFLIILYDRGKLYRITTYTGGWVKGLTADNSEVRLRCGNRKIRLEVFAKGAKSGVLKAPVAGAMSREIHESIGAGVHLKMSDPEGRPIFEDFSEPAGMEVAGDWQILLQNLQ